MKVLVINGPNMNMIGTREPEVFGKGTFPELATYLWKELKDMGIIGILFQSNDEGAIVDKVQTAAESVDGIIINADAYAFTSIAIRDALASVSVPAVQVMFREYHPALPEKSSFLTDVCKKTIIGHGARGFIEAAEYLKSLINE